MAQPHPIAKQLRKIREDKKIARKVLAHRIGYSNNTLRQWECGWRSPTLRSIDWWCQALKVELRAHDLS